jgi:YhcH/YjgK/YiaL family protein
MIIDKLENSGLYKSLNPRITRALEYIKSTNFDILEPGKYEIDGDNIFAIVQEYETKNNTEAKLEAHRKHIDVQFVARGCESVGYLPLEGQELCKEYDPENDYLLVDQESSFTKLDKNMFAIFFPTDLHKPGIIFETISPVKKVVVKVKVD